MRDHQAVWSGLYRETIHFSMPKTLTPKLRHLSIKNYKGIDHLELDFPAPELPGDPDVVVIGSENGLGKTSVLECCALLVLSLSHPHDLEHVRHFRSRFTLPSEWVRSGRFEARISGNIRLLRGDKSVKIDLTLSQDRIDHQADSNILNLFEKQKTKYEHSHPERMLHLLQQVYGVTSDSAIDDFFLFFHGYRKTEEGNPRFSYLFGDHERTLRHRSRFEDGSSTSAFKRVALMLMMGKADLFDHSETKTSGDSLAKLDELVRTYTNCEIAKLRPEGDSIEFRVQPIDGGESFSFDGLSSGQKEIITTLFLVWYETRNQPKVVLVDEPELHLNSQWHRSFINSLHELAPQNQYIIATHSSTIADSVGRSRRIMLQQDEEVVR